MKLLALLLLLLPLSACWAAVVQDFTQSCPGFFATPDGVPSPPTRFNGPQYRQICQTLNNKHWFATFYDTANRIPVYSAYRFKGLADCTRKPGPWKIEPQLEDPRLGGNMDKESAVKSVRNQARNDDYNNQSGSIKYHKGHLAPVYHAESQSCSDATFTLTNAAPQVSSFNIRWFHYAEKPVADFLTKSCINVGLRAYVVTGVVPNNTGTLNGRVRIPSHFWTAFCCFDNNNKPKHSKGYYGKNEEKAVPQPLIVKDLENQLYHLYGRNFTLFGQSSGC